MSEYSLHRCRHAVKHHLSGVVDGRHRVRAQYGIEREMERRRTRWRGQILPRLGWILVGVNDGMEARRHRVGGKRPPAFAAATRMSLRGARKSNGVDNRGFFGFAGVLIAGIGGRHGFSPQS